MPWRGREGAPIWHLLSPLCPSFFSGSALPSPPLKQPSVSPPVKDSSCNKLRSLRGEEKVKSLLSYSKMEPGSRDMKGPYNGWDSEVQPLAILHTSTEIPPTEQHPGQTWRSSPGRCTGLLVAVVCAPQSASSVRRPMAEELPLTQTISAQT